MDILGEKFIAYIKKWNLVYFNGFEAIQGVFTA